MKRYQLAILIVCSVFGIACSLCAVGLVAGGRVLTQIAQSHASSDPTRVAEIGSRIAAFDAPEGYSPLAIDVLTITAVVLQPPLGSHQPTIALTVYTDQESQGTLISGDEALRLARRAISDRGYDTTSEELTVEQGEVRGMKGPIFIVEGYEGNTIVYRYLMAYFASPEGKHASVSIYGPSSGWDQELVDTFITSIR